MAKMAKTRELAMRDGESEKYDKSDNDSRQRNSGLTVGKHLVCESDYGERFSA